MILDVYCDAKMPAVLFIAKVRMSSRTPVRWNMMLRHQASIVR
jgi:hypothetical protein